MIANSVLVEVRLPSANRSYEVRLPRGLNVHVAAILTAQALSSVTEGIYLHSDNSFLAWQNTGKRLPSRKTIAEAGVKNGSKLLLI